MSSKSGQYLLLICYRTKERDLKKKISGQYHPDTLLCILNLHGYDTSNYMNKYLTQGHFFLLALQGVLSAMISSMPNVIGEACHMRLEILDRFCKRLRRCHGNSFNNLLVSWKEKKKCGMKRFGILLIFNVFYSY